MNPSEFERVLERACEILTDTIRDNPAYHGSAPFQRHALDMLRVAARDCDIEIEPAFHPHAFPDIRANGFGVEVKFTKHDSWLAVGNSIFEGMRDPTVHTVYVLFGKAGGDPEVRWGRYEERVTHVRVSHAPRFVIEMESDRAPLFEHMGIKYDQFAALDDESKMRHVREYSRNRLSAGERLWWLEPSHSIPIQVRPYVGLSNNEKRVLRAEAALLCPQVCAAPRSAAGRRKYVDAAIYLLMHHGVFCNQARDLFSAGSVADHVEPLYDDEPYISRALRDIEHFMLDAARRLDDALFEEYWGGRCEPSNRIERWLVRADAIATDWKPSDNLFRGRR